MVLQHRNDGGMRADRGRSYSDIEKLAVAFRRYIDPNLMPDRPAPGIPLFEGLDQLSFDVGGEVMHLESAVNNDLGPAALAEARYINGKIVVTLTEETYLELERGAGRARFTFYHELGHVLLHGVLLKRLSVLPVGDVALSRGTAHKPFENTEWQANALSAAV